MSEPYEEHDESEYITSRNFICDPVCQAANNCGGHAACARCGDVICGYELSEDELCPDCEESKITCANCDESFFEDDLDTYVKDDDGNWFCCAECAEQYAHENHPTLRCDVCGKEFPEDQVIDGCCKECLATV